ncbi:molybdopterin-dependent oxidoreductase, partial [Pseudomonas sp. Bi70]|uniref:nitrate reductase n=1 Tax=Pseudomonas sp. Bi70 TaxID=2821127 RepID=UPI001E5A9E23
LLPGHREVANPEHRAEVAAYWGVDTLPETPGLSAIELFDAVGSGKIKALWIACTNPAQSMPDQHKVHQALRDCPFVVVQEAFTTTETCRYADLLLPAASWGEKEGTVTNSERRVSRVRRAVAAPGEARADWAITCDFARRLEARLPATAVGLFAFNKPEQLFEEYKVLTRRRDLDLSGLGYALLEARGPQQWPFPEGARQGTTRLYGDGHFPSASGRARFITEAYQPPREQRDERYPLTLNTGRLRDQWHGMSRTGTAARLFAHVEEPLLGLPPQDMAQRQLQDGALVEVRSRRGALVLRVQVDNSLQAGQAFLPMHWGDRFLKGLGINALTLPAFDPLSRQPELKHAGIEVQAIELPWTFQALIEGDVQQRLEALRPLCERFAYASFGLVGRDTSALMLRAAHHHAPAAELLDQLHQQLGLSNGPLMRYDDPREGQGCMPIHKRVRIEDGRLTGFALSGETRARNWLRELWQNQTSLDDDSGRALRRWLLAPVESPPGETRARAGKTLCTCMNVSETAVREGIERGCDLNALKQNLGCGTQCGSCVPEIKRLLALQTIEA